MTNQQLQYYYEMAKRRRMFHYKHNERLVCFITYFIGNGNPKKYLDRKPWTVIDDEPGGNVLYIDQLLTDKSRDNVYLSLRIWDDIKEFIKHSFPAIKYICWNRFKREWGKPKTFREGI